MGKNVHPEMSQHPRQTLPSVPGRSSVRMPNSFDVGMLATSFNAFQERKAQRSWQIETVTVSAVERALK